MLRVGSAPSVSCHDLACTYACDDDHSYHHCHEGVKHCKAKMREQLMLGIRCEELPA